MQLYQHCAATKPLFKNRILTFFFTDPLHQKGWVNRHISRECYRYLERPVSQNWLDFSWNPFLSWPRFPEKVISFYPKRNQNSFLHILCRNPGDSKSQFHREQDTKVELFCSKSIQKTQCLCSRQISQPLCTVVILSRLNRCKIKLATDTAKCITYGIFLKQWGNVLLSHNCHFLN